MFFFDFLEDFQTLENVQIFESVSLITVVKITKTHRCTRVSPSHLNNSKHCIVFFFFVLSTDGHHLWETEAKVDKSSVKSVSAHLLQRPSWKSLPSLPDCSSPVPRNDVTFAKALPVAAQTNNDELMQS